MPAMWTARRRSGVAQSAERFGDVFEAEFGGFDLVAEGVKVLDGVGVAHLGYWPPIDADERRSNQECRRSTF